MANKDQSPESLRPAVRAALQCWYTGTELASMFPRRTLYRHRREILDATGIDVLLPKVEQSSTAKPALLALDELRAREVKDVPARIQRTLFGAGV